MTAPSFKKQYVQFVLCSGTALFSSLRIIKINQIPALLELINCKEGVGNILVRWLFVMSSLFPQKKQKLWMGTVVLKGNLTVIVHNFTNAQSYNTHWQINSIWQIGGPTSIVAMQLLLIPFQCSLAHLLSFLTYLGVNYSEEKKQRKHNLCAFHYISFLNI